MLIVEGYDQWASRLTDVSYDTEMGTLLKEYTTLHGDHMEKALKDYKYTNQPGLQWLQLNRKGGL